MVEIGKLFTLPRNHFYLHAKQNTTPTPHTGQRWGQGGGVFILGRDGDALFFYWIGELLRIFHSGWRHRYHLAIAREGGALLPVFTGFIKSFPLLIIFSFF